MSQKRQEILKYISTRIKETGYPPSVREIGQAVGLSSSATVHSHLVRLERDGHITRERIKSRAITIKAS